MPFFGKTVLCNTRTDNMIDTGAVKDVSAIFGLHVWPVVDAGKIASRPGTLLAATNSFLVVVTGRGGHGAYPHMNIDPWPTVANLIMSYQVIDEMPDAVLDNKKVTFMSNIMKPIQQSIHLLFHIASYS